MTLRLASLGAIVAALALGVAAFAGPAQAPANVFGDPAGDEIGTAPDVTGLMYTMDAEGVATFDIAVGLAPGSDTFVSLLVDEDDNARTGDTRLHGADYEVELDYLRYVAGAFVWDATQRLWVAAADDPDFRAGADATHTVISFNRHAVGDPARVDVAVLAGVIDPETGIRFEEDGSPDVDRAPDNDGYAVDLEPLSLSVGSMTHSPAKANTRFSVAMTAVRSDSQDDVTAGDGTVACVLTVAGKRQAPLASPAISAGDAPAASCSWKLAKKSAGKLLRLTITVAAGGASVTRTYSARIR